MIPTLWFLAGLIIVSFGVIVVRGAPYVPTHKKQLDNAFDILYRLDKKDVLVDLGSGDGAVVKAASQRGARAIGYELNPFLIGVSRYRLRHNPNVTIIAKDFLTLRELPASVTVIYAFTTGHNIEEIGRKLEKWSTKKALYFISYGFLLKNSKPVASQGPMHLYKFEPNKA